MKEGILDMLDGKWDDGARPKDLYESTIKKRPDKYVAAVVTGLGSDKRKVQGGCAELASLISEASPALFYPHLDLFLRNLAAKEPILRWEAVCTVGNLAAVDDTGRIPAHLDEIAAHVRNKSIVLQGHAVRALTKIALKWPEYAPGIVDALLASAAHFPNNRVNYLLEACEKLADVPNLKDKPRAAARRFVSSHAKSATASVAKKAAKALKKLDAPPDARTRAAR